VGVVDETENEKWIETLTKQAERGNFELFLIKTDRFSIRCAAISDLSAVEEIRSAG